MRAIGEEMNIGVAADNFSETLAKLPLQETHDLSYPLEREAFAAEFADDCHFSEILHGIDAPMAFSFGLDDSTLVPILQLAGSDTGQACYFMR